MVLAGVPVGESPTGAGGSPAPPIFKISFKPHPGGKNDGSCMDGSEPTIEAASTVKLSVVEESAYAD